MKKQHYMIFAMMFMMLALAVKGQDGLVAHWRFDTVEKGIIYDETLNANHGTNYGGKLIDGIDGRALSFDGKDDYARIPGDGVDPPEILSKLGKGSISLWFKVEYIPKNDGIAPIFYYGAEEKCDFFDAANKGLIIEVGHSPIHYRSERLYFTIWKNGCTFPSFCYDSNNPIPLNKWHHIVVVVGEKWNTGYLNGHEMTNRRYNFGNASYSQFFEDAIAHEKLWLGKGYWDRTVQHFKGAIDELKIYNRPLTAEEIKQMYNKQRGIPTSVLPTGKEEASLRIYPNPVSNRLHFEVQDPDEFITDLQMMDLTGKLVFRETAVNVNEGIDVSHLPEGIYFAVFHGREKTYHKRFTITE